MAISQDLNDMCRKSTRGRPSDGPSVKMVPGYAVHDPGRPLASAPCFGSACHGPIMAEESFQTVSNRKKRIKMWFPRCPIRTLSAVRKGIGLAGIVKTVDRYWIEIVALPPECRNAV